MGFTYSHLQRPATWCIATGVPYRRPGVSIPSGDARGRKKKNTVRAATLLLSEHGPRINHLSGWEINSLRHFHCFLRSFLTIFGLCLLASLSGIGTCLRWFLLLLLLFCQFQEQFFSNKASSGTIFMYDFLPPMHPWPELAAVSRHGNLSQFYYRASAIFIASREPFG